MAQGGSQVDYHILQDLKQRFPEIPEGVVSQFLLQNNNNLDVCCHLLSQESNRYLYGDFHHSPEEMRMSRNHMLHISLGYPGSEAGKSNGGGAGRSLVHSTSDGHIDPQRPSYPEPLSAPATMAPSPSYNPFFMNDQSRSSSTPTPPPTMQDQGAHSATPAPILPISALPANIASQFQHLPRRSSSASDDYAYTQALLLHQRARMERLVKELHMERQKLEQLKTDVNNMEYDALQRRFRRVNSTHLVPRPEEITRLRTHNRQLQIDIDCTLKETDLLQSRGKFDPKAMSNFYDNIQPGPLGPTNPGKKEGEQASKPTPQRDEDFEGAHWNCDSCTLLNHPALNRCEACEMPRYS
ncbi:TGF-beta-activated kinase 1 and MAP3K7-binding protein 3 isoform X3 [Gambusia affinis]|uniref:TGF-beta-activated kinase 1 and MAP3K7-binding protein 3 isoform X3 n=1 Tax=Gambusia affinis TaxID=33528 RepID=UPI001CDC0EE2|nr:TGF-beta-activated kinase 1 and MAP3K7-binding protein 3 isoform X3 [Gambusia affinis]